MNDLISNLRIPFALPGKASKMKLFALTILAVGLLTTGCGSGNKGPAFTAATENLPVQAFTIDAAKGGVINGDHGAILAIPANAFLDAYGRPVKGEIEITLVEANNMKDILVGGLVTQTGENMLASDGMYKIDASQEGESLQLNPDAGIYAYLPADGRDPEMGLYEGAFDQSKLDWKLTSQEQEGLPDPADKMNQKECKKCRNLLKMAKNIKAGTKPGDNEYYAKRHYWENGVLYFASSGSSQPILSKRLLEECEEFLQKSKAGRELLAEVKEIQREQTEKAGAYYTYRITNLGWYNIDKLVKDELVTFAGRVVDKKGRPVDGAKVHLICTDPDSRIHTATTTRDGHFELKFAREKSFRIYAFEGPNVGKQEMEIKYDGQSVEAIAIAPIEQSEMDHFLGDLM